MLEVQKYLKEQTERLGSPAHALDSLADAFAIRQTYHQSDERVCLNYSQIDSPKHHPIVRECRGLVLNAETFEVIARSFPRFFNAGECPVEEKRFDWENFTAEEKADGSLMLLYFWNGSWHVNTRGSFAINEIAHGVGKTWEECFYLAIEEKGFDDLKPGFTYVFEFCSPFNKVVRVYEKPTLYLLTAFHNESGFEMSEVLLNQVAQTLCVKRPERYQVSSLNQIEKWLDAHEEATFEGVVLRDRTGMRLKVKNRRYVSLHRLSDNKNLFNPKYLLPLVLAGELAETARYFPEVLPKAFDLIEMLHGICGRTEAVWEAAKHLEKQKDFAVFVNKYSPRTSSLLFDARKRNIELKEVWRASHEWITKTFA